MHINLTILYIYRLCNNLSSFLCNVTTLDFTIERSDIRKHSLPLDADRSLGLCKNPSHHNTQSPRSSGVVIVLWSLPWKKSNDTLSISAASTPPQQREKRRNTLSPLCSQTAVPLSSRHFLLIPDSFHKPTWDGRPR